MISANLSAVFYLISGILFIFALRGLSSPDTSRQGNYFGIAGMIIAIVVTFLSIGNFSSGFIFVLILISIAIFSLDTTELKPVKFLRSILNDGVYRISAISSSPIKFSSATKDFFIKHMFVYKENERLQSEVQELRKQKFNSSLYRT